MLDPKIKADAVIVSADFTEGPGVLIVGHQVKNKVEVINAFEGEEAKELWEKLVTKKEK